MATEEELKCRINNLTQELEEVDNNRATIVAELEKAKKELSTIRLVGHGDIVTYKYAGTRLIVSLRRIKDYFKTIESLPDYVSFDCFGEIMIGKPGSCSVQQMYNNGDYVPKTNVFDVK